MNKIKILPENVANKIAAGEVAERPASVVKELIENALDAGAKHIGIETQAGGVGLIRISDDGCGMSRDDALLALERHATSKIASESDIAAVQTLGFRGEALPSIASVCRFELITKEPTAAAATAIRSEGGKIQEAKETAHQTGTTVIVRDLFFNIPARRKFLKSHATENSHIAQAIRLAILSRQNVGFRWLCDGQEMFNVVPEAILKDRIAALFESEVAEQLVPVEKALGALKASGFAGKATLTRSNRSLQLFFVNGRPVANRSLSFALSDAYHSLVMTDRQPVCFLFLDIPPQEVDVNVHPAKREVRFRQDAVVRQLVTQGVRAAVQGLEDSPVITPGLPRDQMLREAIAEYQIKHALGTPPAWTSAAAAQGGAAQPAAAQGSLPEQAVLLEEMSTSKTVPRVVGQAHRLYLILESAEGLIILDQHAAHERVLFDQVLKKLRAGKPVESQRLLLPETVSADPAQALLLSQYVQDLCRMGMEVREFGKNAFLVEAVPFFVKTSDIKKLIRDVLDDLATQEKSATVGKAREEKALLTLCRMAVRASDILNEREQQALVDQLMASENPYHCPHGRPTMLKLSSGYLARQFKRV